MYMEPWEILRTFITPRTSESPNPTIPYTRPRSKALTEICSRKSGVSGIKSYYWPSLLKRFRAVPEGLKRTIIKDRGD